MAKQNLLNPSFSCHSSLLLMGAAVADLTAYLLAPFDEACIQAV